MININRQIVPPIKIKIKNKEFHDKLETSYD